MIKRWLIIDLTGWVLIALFCFFVACSPQKRLNRLVKNNPELKHTDTIYSTKTFTVPGYKLDTNFAASQNVNGLDDLINVYREYLDSMKRVKLTSQIKAYIIDRKCLEDTFKVSLNNNGYCKIWQTKNNFHYTLYQPKQKISFTVPLTLNKINATEYKDWKYFWIGFAVAYGIIIILALVGYFFKIYLKR